jgi:hypothetical protein
MKIMLVPNSVRPLEQAAYLLSILEVLGHRTDRNVRLQSTLSEILCELSEPNFSEDDARRILTGARKHMARLGLPAQTPKPRPRPGRN